MKPIKMSQLAEFNPSELSEGYEARENGLLANAGTVTTLWLLSIPAAWAISYSKNQSVLWAFASGVISVPYLVFSGFTYFIDKGKK